MDNNTILNNRWKYTDNRLREYLRLYKKISLRTQDNIQDIFNSISYSYADLGKPISTNQRKKLKRIIDEWKDNNLLNGYFKYKVDELMEKRYITNEEMLDILLWGTYVKERSQLDKHEQVLFTEVGQDLYNQGIEEIKPKKKKKRSLTWEYIWSLLTLPNIKGDKWTTYIEAIVLTYSQEIKRQAMIHLQQNRELDIYDNAFQNIIKKQQNKYLSINSDKYSGALDIQTMEIGNQALLKAGKDYGDKRLKARFIAEIDDRTTEMCQSMDNLIFNVNDWNTFQRYSDDDGRIINYTVYGLEAGVNLPPINNHFHYCRSTIIYMLDYINKSLIAEYSQLKRLLPDEIPNTIDEYADLRYNKKGYYEEIKQKEEVIKHYNKDFEIGENKKTISFNEYYNNVVEANNKLKGFKTIDNNTISEVKLHAVDRMIDRNIDIEKIKDILNNPTSQWESKINDSIVYFKDKKMVAIDNKEFFIKTVYKGRGKKNE